MTPNEHIDALRQKHAELEASIQKEESRPMPDDDVIKGLKRQKLAIKDRIAGLEHRA